MRLMGLVAALGLAGSALASFDLALVLDSAQDVVHRYDADSGVYLGNFGAGSLSNVRGIAVDKNTKTAFITHDDGYSAWDYNTGFFKFYSDRIGASYTAITVTGDGRLLFSANGVTSSPYRRVNSLLPAGSISFAGSSTISGPFSAVVEGPSGDYYAVKGSTGDVVLYNSATNLQSSTFNAAELAGTTIGFSDGTHYTALAANGRAWRVSLIGGVGIGGFNPSNPFTSSVQLVQGHESEAWGLGTNASGARLQRFFRDQGGTGSFYDPIGPGRTLSQVGTAAGLAIVTAPEPGTLFALGVGAAALLRRRRAR